MKFIKPFSGVKAGEVYPTDFEPGDTCPAELIEAATELSAIETKPAPAKAEKRGKKD